jgi:hypothetical protein
MYRLNGFHGLVRIFFCHSVGNFQNRRRFLRNDKKNPFNPSIHPIVSYKVVEVATLSITHRMIVGIGMNLQNKKGA